MNTLLWYKTLLNNQVSAFCSRDEELTLLFPKSRSDSNIKNCSLCHHKAKDTSSLLPEQQGVQITNKTNHHALKRDAISGRSLGSSFPLTDDDNSTWQQNQGLNKNKTKMFIQRIWSTFCSLCRYWFHYTLHQEEHSPCPEKQIHEELWWGRALDMQVTRCRWNHCEFWPQ